MQSPTRSRAWVAWSSGKDSLWALHLARRRPDLEVVGLLTTITHTFGRVSMHGVRECLVEAQARALDLPLHRVLIPYPCPNEVYEAEMAKAVAEAQEGGVTRMVFGDLFLSDVRAYREEKLAGTGIEAVFPLWGSDTRALAEGMIAAGVRAYLTCLDPRKVCRGLAGHPFDGDFLAKLPREVDTLGENGEFHTFVWDGPGFSQPVQVTVGETVERDGFVFTDLLPDRRSPAQRGGTPPGSSPSGSPRFGAPPSATGAQPGGSF